jgi:type II secretion system protein C
MKLPQHPALPWISLAVLAYLSGDLAAAAIEQQFNAAPRRQTTTNTTTTAVLAGLKQPGELSFLLSNKKTDPQFANVTTGGNQTTVTGPGPGQVPGQVTPGNATALPTLAGTMEGQGQSLAVLQVGQETQVVAVGEEWMGYKVMEVGAFQARLKDARGQEHTVSMALAGAQNAAPGPVVYPPGTMPPITNTTVTNTTPGTPDAGGPVTSRQIKAWFDDKSFVRNILVQPVKRNDEVAGIQINYSNPDNPFAKLGIQSGDIIQTFNSRPVKGMEDMDWALKELRNAQSLNFQVERNGQQVPVSLQVAP